MVTFEDDNQIILDTKSCDTSAAAQNAEMQLNHSQAKFTGWFPLGYKEGFSQWWTDLAPNVTESKVLSFVPYIERSPDLSENCSTLQSANVSKVSVTNIQSGKADTVSTASSVTDPYGPRRWHSSLVQLSGSHRALNEYSVERVGEDVENNLVMVHGYGAGLGFFYKNYEGLSRLPGWRVYALDLLGMGRSSRPPFQIRARDRQEQINEAENWFIDAIEEWRISRKIEQFTLLGHSLGGYMAVAYALKYPGRLNKLILASPVGIPEDPYAVNADLPEPTFSTVTSEFADDQISTTGNMNTRLPTSKRTTLSEVETTKERQPRPRRMPQWMVYLWEANISPFSIVRWSGPLGPRLVSGWTSRRFAHLPLPEAQALHEYSYSLFRQRGSGEYVLAYILAPGAFARSPLIRRIHGIGRQIIPHALISAEEGTSISFATNARENGIPVVLMYGENDWMDVAGGYAATERIKLEKEKLLKGANEDIRAQDNGEAKVVIIKKAGHHLYLDAPEQFDHVVRNEMLGVERRQASSYPRTW